MAESKQEEILNAFLSDHGLKSTRQRTLVVDTFLETEGHVTVDELLARVRSVEPRISAATVYRTMKLLAECGLANTQQFGEGHRVYEQAAGREHHDHFICTRCGLVEEFEDQRIESLQNEVAKTKGFQVTRHRMELYGLCSQCQKAEPSEQKERS